MILGFCCKKFVVCAVFVFAEVTKKIFVELTNCENVEFSEGKTIKLVLGPAEQKTVKRLSCGSLEGGRVGCIKNSPSHPCRQGLRVVF